MNVVVPGRAAAACLICSRQTKSPYHVMCQLSGIRIYPVLLCLVPKYLQHLLILPKSGIYTGFFAEGGGMGVALQRA